jgi:glycosyltransferase involved in cell wall biosynthesis
MQKKVVKQLDNLVTVSGASRQDIATDFTISETKLRIVHNGIDTEMFRPIPAIEPEEFNVMATASADVPLKGLDYLIRAISVLAEEIPELKLTVLGKLKEDGKTAKLIKQLGLENRIHFYSELSSQEVAELYAKATCAVVPSIYEGFGLPAGEAMACGVPLISTNGGALPEVVGDAGITVATRDHLALADAIRTLLADSSLQQTLAAKGRTRILELFSWEVAAGDMVQLYREVVSGKATN